MTRAKRLVIVQARMASTRLPKKVLLELGGRPVLARMIERLARASQPDQIVIATTDQPADQPIAELCERERWECFRGHPNDLLDRHWQCALAYDADIVAKIPSDVPLIDAELVDATFEMYDRGTFEYVSNLHPPTFPDGQDVEVFGIEVLRTAWREATKDYEREHTTPFIWDNPQRFRLGNIEAPGGVDYSLTHRWTIDYPEDYEFLCRVYEEFWSRRPGFSWQELMEFLGEHPEIADINKERLGITWHRHHLQEFKHVHDSWTKGAKRSG